MNVLQIDNLSKSFGAKTLFENISFSIVRGEKVALIAKNGVGKSTLISIITGAEIADSGAVILSKDVHTGFLPQEPQFDGSKTVMEQVFASSDKLIATVKNYNAAMVSGKESEIQHAVSEMDRMGAWDYESRISQILTKLKITDFEQPVNQLSGGQKKRLALANTLINTPDFLILDEPTNHLDFDMIEWLEDYLAQSHVTLLLVTHDRYFLDKVCNRILEIDDNVMYAYRGTYHEYLQKRAERIEQMTTDIENARRLLKRETEWMNRMPQARTTKAKYREDNYWKVKDAAERKVDNSKVEMQAMAARLGSKIVDIYGVSKSFGDKIIVDDFSYKFNRFEKIGVAGNNGTGKSTFLNLLTNNILPEKGHIEVGETVVFGYYRQEGLQLDDNMRVIEVITSIAERISVGKDYEISAAQFLERFLFPRHTHYEDVSKLSGGQKRRLYLMTVLMRNPNFLILDEPTNDFDIATLNVLEEFLQNYQGNVLVVSHDRYFTDRVAETLFVFEGDGKIRHFPGNYSAWREHKSEQEAQKALEQKSKEIKQEKPKSVSSNKLTFKEKQELNQLERDLEKLNSEKSQIESDLSSGRLSGVEIVSKSERFTELTNLIDDFELRWLELSEREA